MAVTAHCPQCGQPMLTGGALCGHCLLRAGSGYEYGVINVLGEGPHGTVYLAEQQPGKRLVALKVLRGNDDPELTVSRLRQQRRALETAAMAAATRIVDVGLTDERRPYLATEYVRGLPITAYCDRWRADRPERLRLIDAARTVLRAAHKAGIVHGALKPSNVLVVRGEEDLPTLKVLDFGLCRGSEAGDLAALAALTDEVLRTTRS